jgi:hypothetical protein
MRIIVTDSYKDMSLEATKILSRSDLSEAGQCLRTGDRQHAARHV